MESVPLDRILVGSGKLLLCIITVGRFPECVVCKLDEIRDGLKGNLIVITAPM